MRCLFLPAILVNLRIAWANGSATHSHNHSHHLLEHGNCKQHTWRTDSLAMLPGNCVGINPTHEFSDLKDLPIRDWYESAVLQSWRPMYIVAVSKHNSDMLHLPAAFSTRL